MFNLNFLKKPASPAAPESQPNRCHFQHQNGRRCRLPVADKTTPFCGTHRDMLSLAKTKEEKQAEAAAITAEIYGPVKNLDSATAIHHVLSNLFRLTLQDRIPQRKAAQLTTQLRLALRTLEARRSETTTAKLFPQNHGDLLDLLALLTGNEINEQTAATHPACPERTRREHVAREGSAVDSEPGPELVEAELAPPASCRDKVQAPTSATNPDPENQHTVVAASVRSPGSGQSPRSEETQDPSTAANRTTVAPQSTAASSATSNRTAHSDTEYSATAAAPGPAVQQINRAVRDQYLSAEGQRTVPLRGTQSANSSRAFRDEIFRSTNRGSQEPRKNWFSKWFSKTQENPAPPDHRSRADFASDTHAGDLFLARPDEEFTDATSAEPQFPYQSSTEVAPPSQPSPYLFDDHVLWIGPKPNQINWALLEESKKAYLRYLRQAYPPPMNGYHFIPPDELPLWLRPKRR
jgi:hypothetical protein